MGRVCYHPCETVVQPRAARRRGRDPRRRAVPRRRGDPRRLALQPPDAAPTGKRVLVVGAGPSGLSAAYHLRARGHAVTIRDAGPLAGGMMRFGIPTYRLPRDVLDAEIAADPRPRRDARAGRHGHELLEAMHEGGFDARFLAVGAHIGRRAYIPAGEAAHIIDAVSLLHEMEGERATPARPARRRLRRRQHGDRRRADRQATRRRGGDRRLPPHARAHARPRLRGAAGARGGRDDQVALDDQAGRRGQARAREHGARRDRLSAADRRARGARRRLARARARPGRRPLAARRRARDARSTTASSRSTSG